MWLSAVSLSLAIAAVASLDGYASWGYFDFRREDEGFDEGYQSVPVNWAISSPRKRASFEKVREITGGCEVPDR